MLDTLSLEYFATVARERSVTRAARKLHTSQPAVSRRIRQLEHALGTALFVRRSTGVVLTPAGRALQHYADEMGRLSTEARVRVRQAAGGDRLTARIGFHSAAADLLGPLLRRLQQAKPGLEIDVTEGKPGLLLEALDQLEIDVALPGHARPDVLDLFDGLPISSSPLICFVPKDHRLAPRRKLKAGELRNERFVALDERDFPGCQQAITRYCRTAGFTPQVSRHAQSMTEAIAHVIAGRGVALLPEAATASPLSATVGVVPSNATCELYALWNRSSGNPLLPVLTRILRDLAPSNSGAKAASRAPEVRSNPGKRTGRPRDR